MSRRGGRDEVARAQMEEEVKGGKRAEKVAYIRTGQMRTALIHTRNDDLRDIYLDLGRSLRL